MGLFQVLDISAAGMDVEQLRLKVAAANIANARTTAGVDGVPYRPLEVVVRTAASGATLPRPVAFEVVAADVAPRRVYEPGHPDAGPDGFINLPGIDPITSMVDLLQISRSYEANLRAFDVTRSLLQRTLEMGSKR